MRPGGCACGRAVRVGWAHVGFVCSGAPTHYLSGQCCGTCRQACKHAHAPPATPTGRCCRLQVPGAPELQCAICLPESLLQLAYDSDREGGRPCSACCDLRRALSSFCRGQPPGPRLTASHGQTCFVPTLWSTLVSVIQASRGGRRVPCAPAIRTLQASCCARCAPAAAAAAVEEGFRRAGGAKLSWLRGLHLEGASANTAPGSWLVHAAAGDGTSSLSGASMEEEQQQQQQQQEWEGARQPPSGRDSSPEEHAGRWGPAAGAPWAQHSSSSDSGDGGVSGADSSATWRSWTTVGAFSEAETVAEAAPRELASLLTLGSEGRPSSTEPGHHSPGTGPAVAGGAQAAACAGRREGSGTPEAAR